MSKDRLEFGTHILCPNCKGKGQKRNQICGLCLGAKFITKKETNEQKQRKELG